MTFILFKNAQIQRKYVFEKEKKKIKKIKKQFFLIHNKMWNVKFTYMKLY